MARTKEKGKERTRRLEFGVFALRDLKKAGEKTVSGNGTKESARTHSRCSSKYPVMSHPLPCNRTPHFSYLFVHINLLLMDSNIHLARNLPPAQMMDILRASAKDSLMQLGVFIDAPERVYHSACICTQQLQRGWDGSWEEGRQTRILFSSEAGASSASMRFF